VTSTPVMSFDCCVSDENVLEEEEHNTRPDASTFPATVADSIDWQSNGIVKEDIVSTFRIR